MLNLFLFALFISSLYHILKIILGPSIWDRLLGFNLFSLHIVLIILIYSVQTRLYYLIDIALVYVLLGFISTIFIVRYIKRGGNM